MEVTTMQTLHTARTIREIMTVHPKTVGSKTPLHTLRDRFVTYGFNAFPVVDEGNMLLGIVTKLDLLRILRHDRRRILPDLGALRAEHVEDIMRRGVVTVTPGDPVAAAMDRMLASRLRSLPVVERVGRTKYLVGIVSRSDVLRGVGFDTRDAS
jgi:CBS domain-containing protein